MNGEQLHKIAKDFADGLPGSYQDFPFGPEHLVYRIENKIFLFISEVRKEKIITIKSEPNQALINKSIFFGIVSGYHMNKKHWITIIPDKDVSKDLLQDLIKSSYEEVIKKLPKNKRTNLYRK